VRRAYPSTNVGGALRAATPLVTVADGDIASHVGASCRRHLLSRTQPITPGYPMESGGRLTSEPASAWLPSDMIWKVRCRWGIFAGNSWDFRQVAQQVLWARNNDKPKAIDGRPNRYGVPREIAVPLRRCQIPDHQGTRRTDPGAITASGPGDGGADHIHLQHPQVSRDNHLLARKWSSTDQARQGTPWTRYVWQTPVPYCEHSLRKRSPKAHARGGVPAACEAAPFPQQPTPSSGSEPRQIEDEDD